MGSDQVKAFIPMKPLASSKQRLASVLPPERRALLSLWMLERVLTVVAPCRQVGEVAVVGGDTSVARLCGEMGVKWQPDPAMELNTALETARYDAAKASWAGILFLAGDLPLLGPAEVEGMLPGPRPMSLVLAPGRRGGTNGITLPDGLGFRFEMGGASFSRHAAQAARLGVAWRAFNAPGLEADVDLPEDLVELERAAPHLWRLVTAMERFVTKVRPHLDAAARRTA